MFSEGGHPGRIWHGPDPRDERHDQAHRHKREGWLRGLHEQQADPLAVHREQRLEQTLHGVPRGALHRHIQAGAQNKI
eukprot:802768-Prorocentrum_minimum.AAC.1